MSRHLNRILPQYLHYWSLIGYDNRFHDSKVIILINKGQVLLHLVTTVVLTTT